MVGREKGSITFGTDESNYDLVNAAENNSISSNTEEQSKPKLEVTMRNNISNLISLSQGEKDVPLEFEIILSKVEKDALSVIHNASCLLYVESVENISANVSIIQSWDVLVAFNGLPQTSSGEKTWNLVNASTLTHNSFRFLRWPRIIKNLSLFHKRIKEWSASVDTARMCIHKKVLEMYIKQLSQRQEKNTVSNSNVQTRNHPLWIKWGKKCKCTDTESPFDEPHAPVPSFYWNPFTGATSENTFPDISTDSCGGILADEMGLGKTLEMLSLVSSNCLVSPVIDSNIILSPHVPLAADVYKYIKDEKGLIVSRATIIVTPVSIIQQWVGEIRKHAPTLVVTIFEGGGTKGSSEGSSLLQLAVSDIVLITYSALAKEINFSLEECGYPLRNAKRYMLEYSPLLKIKWWRIVLDEAQFVESTVRQCAQMAGKLEAVNRWCLTGEKKMTCVYVR
jgi:hypothetical protein